MITAKPKKEPRKVSVDNYEGLWEHHLRPGLPNQLAHAGLQGRGGPTYPVKRKRPDGIARESSTGRLPGFGPKP